MKEMDCVEVIVEKECYVKEGVHKGMQGWICLEQRTEGYWLVNFPQYGEKDDSSDHSSIKVNSINVTLIYDNIKLGMPADSPLLFKKSFWVSEPVLE